MEIMALARRRGLAKRRESFFHYTGIFRGGLRSSHKADRQFCLAFHNWEWGFRGGVRKPRVPGKAEKEGKGKVRTQPIVFLEASYGIPHTR